MVRLTLALLTVWSLQVTYAQTGSRIEVAPGLVQIAADGQCSLLEALVNANQDAAVHPDCQAGSGADVVVLAPSARYVLTEPFAYDSLRGASGLPTLTGVLTIEGQGAVLTRDSTLSCEPAQAFRIGYLAPEAQMRLYDLTLQYGCGQRGGAFYVDAGAVLQAERVVFRQNWADQGAAVYNRGTLHLLEAQIIQNRASYGSAIYNDEATVQIQQSWFASNEDNALYNKSGNVFVEASTFEDNEGFDGGALYNDQGVAKLQQVVFRNNDARFSGGAIYNSGGILEVIQSEFEDNASEYSGGAIKNLGGALTLQACTFRNNDSDSDGGAISVYEGQVLIEQTNFIANIAEDAGGAIDAYLGDSLIVRQSRFEHNQSNDYGGAIYGRNIRIEQTLFAHNQSGGGGAIEGENVYILNSTFLGNRAFDGDGGALSLDGRSHLSFVTIVDNSASDNGDGIVYEGLLRVAHVLLARNGENCANGGGELTIVGLSFADDESCPGFVRVDDVGLADSLAVGLPVVPLLPTSPALGAAPGCLDATGRPVTTDGRGMSRPQPSIGGYCDAGAYEAEAVVATPLEPDTVWVNFGSVPYQTSARRTVALTNQGNGPVTLRLALLGYQVETEELTLDETETGSCRDGLVLNAGAQCQLHLVFQPRRAGLRQAALRVQVANAEPLYLIVVGNGELVRTFTVNVTEDLPDADPGDLQCDADSTTAGEQCTLRAAVMEANRWPYGIFRILLADTATYRLSLPDVNWEDTYLAQEGALTIASKVNIAIEGNGALITRADTSCSTQAANQYPLFEVAGGAGLQLVNLQLSNGCYTAVFSQGQLQLHSVVLRNNYSTFSWAGSALDLDEWTYPAAAILEEVVVEENQSVPVWLKGGLLHIQRSVLRRNSDRRVSGWAFYGGAIRVSGGHLMLEATHVEGNFSASGSGGVHVTGGRVEVKQSTFTQNMGKYGGAIAISAGTLDIEASHFVANEAEEGGAIWVRQAWEERVNATLKQSVLRSNRATREGGGVWGGWGAQLTLLQSAVVENQAGNEGGGGIYVGGEEMPTKLNLINVTLSGNSTSGTGGGIDATSYDQLNLSFVTLTQNQAARGGGIYSDGLVGAKQLKAVLLVGNHAPEGPECYGQLTSAGYNGVANLEDCALTAMPTDVIGQPLELAPLDTLTFTHPLLDGSWALDRVPAEACVDLFGEPVGSDQRGVTRPQGTHCDIGAWERIVPVASEPTTRLPEIITLAAPYPNPFHRRVQVRFGLPKAQHVRLVVYDVLGREVARLQEAFLPAGWHEFTWDAPPLAGGLYFLQLQAGSVYQTQAMLKLRD